MVRYKKEKINFTLKEAHEYYKYLHTLSDSALIQEWGKVTNELKKAFGSVSNKKHYERNSSSSTMFV